MFPLLSVPVLSFVSQNVTANHRVNDAVFTEDGAQMVMGRFMYGPLDMVTLTGEKVKLPHALHNRRLGKAGPETGSSVVVSCRSTSTS